LRRQKGTEIMFQKKESKEHDFFLSRKEKGYIMGYLLNAKTWNGPRNRFPKQTKKTHVATHDKRTIWGIYGTKNKAPATQERDNFKNNRGTKQPEKGGAVLHYQMQFSTKPLENQVTSRKQRMKRFGETKRGGGN